MLKVEQVFLKIYVKLIQTSERFYNCICLYLIMKNCLETFDKKRQKAVAWRCSVKKPRLWHKCFHENFAKFEEHFFLWNTSDGCFWKYIVHLLLYFTYCNLFNLSCPSPPRRKKINLNLYFHTSLWCVKRFYEGLKGLHKTVWGITKKCENKNLS